MTNERRNKPATRDRVTEMLDEGWDIISRDPLKLSRGGAVAEIKPNGVIVYGYR